jgi:tyrosine-protein kinase
MNDEPRYASLQDYLKVLRKHRLLVIGSMLVFAVGAFVLSSTATPTYVASTSLSFREPAQDASTFGENLLPVQSAQERASIGGELATSPAVARAVKKDLNTDLTVDELLSRVTTTVDVRSLLVRLDAEDSEAEFAARLANSFARQTQKLKTREERDSLNRAITTAERELEAARDLPESTTKDGQIALIQQSISRLRQLRSISEPVVISQDAAVPGSPTSPRPVRNTIIGLIVGAIVGLLAAFTRAALDRRLHSAHDVHEETRLPVLGRVSETALGQPGLAGNLNGYGTMTELDFEAFRMLRMNLAALGQDGGRLKSVLVTSGFPEEGKSTVSMALASAAALAGQNVLLVECDLRRPTFMRRLGVEAQPGLTDYLTGQAQPQEILRTVDLFEPAPWSQVLKKRNGQRSNKVVAHLVCITAGTPVQTPAELLVSERFKSFLDKVTKAYDLVVIDSSPMLAVVDPLEIVPLVDGVLLCVRVQQTSRDQARATRAALGNLPEKPVGAVVTGFKRGDPESYDYYYGY